VTFDVTADAYDRFMGRFSGPLAQEFLRVLDPAPGSSALDVGCGPGALTSVLVRRLGAEAVTAVDPSAPFVAAVRHRCPGVDVAVAAAERLPFADGSYDVVAAQLVVHFMTDPVAGIREMRRVGRERVAACVWDHAGVGGPLSAFWRAAKALDRQAPDEARLAGTGEGQLAALFAQAGLRAVEAGRIEAVVRFGSFEEWWEPFTLGVGPAGSYVRGLTPERSAELRERCRDELPAAPFVVSAAAWYAAAKPRLSPDPRP
jgi:SAM-dependent methyltransferase